MDEASARVAVVAGATGALGRAVAQRLTSDFDAVLAVDRRAASHPSSFTPLVCDLADPEAVAALPERVAGMGRWRALAVCTGGFAPGQAHRLSEEVVRDQLEGNLLVPWRLCAAAATAMAEAGGGSIVVVAGRAAVEVAAGQAAYQVAKTAVARLVQVMALELRDVGVRVNAVLPSTMDTPSNRAAMPSADASRWVPTDTVAGAVAWLLSDASDQVSGALLPVYGRA